MISSQDFRNKYEPFYDAMRLYLWPYDVLEVLANVEVEIYTDFIDRDKLLSDFNKLKNMIRETLNEDENLQKACTDLEEVINDETSDSYYLINRVNEINPEIDKVLKQNDKEEDEDSLIGGVSYENKQSGII